MFHSHLTDFIEPKFIEHNGRLFKTMGDGLLAEFTSVIEAVQCAVAIQEGMRLRNSDVPQEQRLEFRIGVNLGDIIVQDDDLFGDGVNVAARLEGLAEPGGICISRSARDQIRDKLSYGLEDWGEVEVKNIPRPVRVFRVLPGEDDAGKVVARAAGRGLSKRAWAASITAVLIFAASAVVILNQQRAGIVLPNSGGTADFQSGKPSIAVLPFANMSNDTAQEYFSDGLAEDLTTDLSKIAALTVIAPDSSASFKEDDADVGNIAEILGVRYVIKGSVRKIGESVRINTKLIDAASGAHVWAERYDRKFSEVFALQDEILESIVAALSVKLAVPGNETVSKRGTKNSDAYDLFLQARHLESQSTKAAIEEALSLYERALDLDPKFAIVYARMANLHEQNVRGGWAENTSQELDTAQRLARRAIALDGKNPVCALDAGSGNQRKHRCYRGTRH